MLDRKEQGVTAIGQQANLLINIVIRMDVCRKLGAWKISRIRVLGRI
jgi:hypothetical protein